MIPDAPPGWSQKNPSQIARTNLFGVIVRRPSKFAFLHDPPEPITHSRACLQGFGTKGCSSVPRCVYLCRAAVGCRPCANCCIVPCHEHHRGRGLATMWKKSYVAMVSQPPGARTGANAHVLFRYRISELHCKKMI